MLALDLATKTGWALWKPDSPVTSGAETFPKELGEFALSFERWLSAKVTACNVGCIVVEAPVPVRGTTKLDTLLKLHGAHVLVRLVAQKLKVPIRSIHLSTWRVHFIGVTHAPAAILSKSRRRTWLKKAVMEECARRGWEVTTDDEADARGLLDCARTTITPTLDRGATCPPSRSLARPRNRKSSLSVAINRPRRSPKSSASRQIS